LDYTLGLLHCRAVFPKELEWTTYSMGGIITRLLPDSTRYYCEFVLPSDAKLDVL